MNRDLLLSLRYARRRVRGGLYLAPSLFTFANLLLGYCSLTASLRGEFELAGILILFAAVADLTDGWIARLTGTASSFGVQLDSLTDLLSFGMAPALLLYTWGLHNIPRGGIALTFLFVCGGATRLARFNVQHAIADRRFFVGLPIPTAAAILVSWVLIRPGPQETGPYVTFVCALLVLTSFLMVSTVRYGSFKAGTEGPKRRSRVLFYFLGLAAVPFIFWPTPTLALLGLVYLASGPVARAGQWLFRRRSFAPAPANPRGGPP